MVSEFAITNGMRSLHIAVLAHNEARDSLPSLWQWPAMNPLAKALSTTSWTLLDLRPFRPFARAGRLGVLAPDLRRLIDTYDFLVSLGGAHDASFTAVLQHQGSR
jgi:hypothetical protein